MFEQHQTKHKANQSQAGNTMNQNYEFHSETVGENQ